MAPEIAKSTAIQDAPDGPTSEYECLRIPALLFTDASIQRV